MIGMNVLAGTNDDGKYWAWILFYDRDGNAYEAVFNEAYGWTVNLLDVDKRMYTSDE